MIQHCQVFKLKRRARVGEADAAHRSRRLARQRKHLKSGNFAEPSDGLEPSTPSLPSLRQLVATGGNGFGC